MKKVLVLASIALASSLMASNGAELYKKCVSCHGVNAEKPAMGKSAVIADWTVEQNVAALKGYKDGTYGGPMKALMKGQVANYSEEDMKAVSEHVVSLKK